MKNILVSLLLGVPLLSLINNIVNKTNNNSSSTNNNNLKSTNDAYIRLENNIVEMLNGKISINFNNIKSDYTKIISDCDAAIWNEPVNQITASFKKINDEWMTWLTNWFTHMSSYDSSYISQYLNLAYRFIPLYTVMPWIHTDIFKKYELTQKEINNFNSILTLMSNLAWQFGTGLYVVQDVQAYFNKNMNIQKGYTPILDQITTTNPFYNINPAKQYNGPGGGFYDFYLFYNNEIGGVKNIIFHIKPSKHLNQVEFK